ncbi:DUF4158 domain-containing protein [Streptomyces sp. NPDC057580]|uniref:DUF4158 domain-containing protein n=1 Tax=Streptomyces sp. NPDC057580 TaxID=3346173 RepID=UPI0036C27AD0
MLVVVWVLGWVVTSIERTAYPRFKRLITAHELHLFFSPTRDELEWAADRTDSDEHLLALLLTLKSYQRMGCFPKVEIIPEAVAEFVRRAVELPEGTLAVYRAAKTMKNHLGLVRQRVGVAYDQGRARRIAEESIRKEAASTNRPGDPPWRTWAGEGAGREVPGPCVSGYEDLGAQTGGGVALRVRPGVARACPRPTGRCTGSAPCRTWLCPAPAARRRKIGVARRVAGSDQRVVDVPAGADLGALAGEAALA